MDTLWKDKITIQRLIRQRLVLKTLFFLEQLSSRYPPLRIIKQLHTYERKYMYCSFHYTELRFQLTTFGDVRGRLTRV